MKDIVVILTMVLGGIWAFFAAALSHGKPQVGGEASRNFWFGLIAGVVVFCLPPFLIRILNQLGLAKWWGLCLFCFLLLVFAIGSAVVSYAWR